MSGMEELTVIVPMYNAEAYIEECIKSIMRQKAPVCSIIIVDDGSVDDGPDICRKLAKKDGRIEVISQPNGGSSAARYTGIKACTTKYVTFVDADDFILDNAFDSAKALMATDVDMIVYDIARYFDENNINRSKQLVSKGKYNRERIEKEIYPKLIWDFNRGCPGVDCSLCTRIIKINLIKEMFRSMEGCFFYHYGDDASIVYPLYKDIKSMVVLNECYYMHRQRKTEVASYIGNDGFFDEALRLYHHLQNAFGEDKETLKKQIDYFFMYAVELRKMLYDDHKWNPDYLFPFEKVPSGKNVVIYGAGVVGSTYYKQLKKRSYCSDILWVDRNYEKLGISDVSAPLCISKYDYDYVVIAIDGASLCDEIKKMLINDMGVDESCIVF